eukprot:CAMPEP_0183348484 /NCGR_PEP_ID=MMETSP0164_2-20130417/12979_1 /TAXON_ID=221442 /ORGANISM="Coccolithus pelagicus ssp braarudi, Strain PLY182g" /LENGTH=189 /DNA_ID=CAMNT_0025520087 /DNA_START=10 /DNA_END=579 /DNA_ORIENTATION=-
MLPPAIAFSAALSRGLQATLVISCSPRMGVEVASISSLRRRAALHALLSTAVAHYATTAHAQGPPIYPILAAQSATSWIGQRDDEETFRTMVLIGLPDTGRLQMPPSIQFNLFKAIEPTLIEDRQGPFMDAAIEYLEYTRDANDLVELAKGSRRQGAPQAVTLDYLSRAIEAAKGSTAALNRMVPLLDK